MFCARKVNTKPEKNVIFSRKMHNRAGQKGAVAGRMHNNGA